MSRIISVVVSFKNTFYSAWDALLLFSQCYWIVPTEVLDKELCNIILKISLSQAFSTASWRAGLRKSDEYLKIVSQLINNKYRTKSRIGLFCQIIRQWMLPNKQESMKKLYKFKVILSNKIQDSLIIYSVANMSISTRERKWKKKQGS